MNTLWCIYVYIYIFKDIDSCIVKQSSLNSFSLRLNKRSSLSNAAFISFDWMTQKTRRYLIYGLCLFVLPVQWQISQWTIRNMSKYINTFSYISYHLIFIKTRFIYHWSFSINLHYSIFPYSVCYSFTKLTTLGINPTDISFSTLTMESDKFICI